MRGEFKGRRIKVPRGYRVRPTSSRVREALFSLIAVSVPESRVLDLFAGAGSLGIEALSRGAAHAVFVEKSRKTASMIAENLRVLKVARSQFEVVISDAFHYLSMAAKKRIVFDIIFIDPPYRSHLGSKTLSVLAKNPLLTEGGLVLNEFEKGEDLIIPEEFKLEKEKNYGDTSIIICTQREGKR